MHRDVVVLAGYFVRCPLGGYAWQVLHYLSGLRAAGYDPYFYEDTVHYDRCLDPVSGDFDASPDAGVAAAAAFFERTGFGNRWIFRDVQHRRHFGVPPAEAAEVLATARVVISLATINRVPRHGRQLKIFIDIDPGLTQIWAARGDTTLREVLAENDRHFTFGENIGQPACAVPTVGIAWQPTRQPVALEWWDPLPHDAAAPYTTVGRWDEARRDVEFGGHVFRWRKRTEWLRFLDLPQRTGAAFTLAMDIDKTPDDAALLRAHGWTVIDPLSVSSDPFVYRDFVRRSRGEFTVAKDLNIRLRTGWLSDRAACYLAAGRPVVTQDTGVDRILPTNRGLLAVHTPADAVAAFATLAAGYDEHAAAARRIAEEYLDAGRVVATLLNGL